MSYNSVIKQIELNLSGKENCGSYDARLDWIEAQLGIAPVAPNLRWNVEARIQEILRRINSYVLKTVSGTLPLTLTNAVAEAIVSLIQYGKCLQITNPTPSNPSLIFCNNGVLKFGALGRNLCDSSASNIVLQCYINKSDGALNQSPPNFMFANYMPVVGGKTYVAYGRAKSGNDISDYNRVAWYDSNKEWISGADYTQNRIAIVTAPNDAAYARFSCNPTGTTTTVVTQEIVDSFNWTFAEGNAEILPFVPFEGGVYADGTKEILNVNSETAHAKDLLSCGESEDEQDIISGAITRKVGVYVFDGTENFTPSGIGPTGPKGWTTPSADKVRSKVGAICSHYPYSSATLSSAPNKSFITFASENIGFKDSAFTSAEDLKAFFAEQYAAGTPVIVVYPLASAVTERTEPQILHTEDGTNTISVTANVPDIKAEVTYCSSEE